jgi:hypothetical protein
MRGHDTLDLNILMLLLSAYCYCDEQQYVQCMADPLTSGRRHAGR